MFPVLSKTKENGLNTLKMKNIKILLLLICCFSMHLTFAQTTKSTNLSAWSFDLGLESGFRKRNKGSNIFSTNTPAGEIRPYQQDEFFLPLGILASVEYSISKKLALSLDFAYHHLPTYTDRYIETQKYLYDSEVYEKKSDEFSLYSAFIRTGVGLKIYFNKTPIGGYFKINANYYAVNSDVYRTTISESSFHYEGYNYAPVKVSSSAFGLSLEWGKRRVIGDRFYADFGIRYSKPILSLSDKTYDKNWNSKVFYNNQIKDYFPTSNMYYHQFKTINAEYLQFYLKLGIFKFNI
ncbi:hypothetical protein [Lishizhenia sp.]|uniref:hypothetical protein n=1 Tax=Lishizhenia sp. TaxID=2497594 RepID=UPI00299E426E|nr:hypothetical protein [Lishizhenia sp.]MDX1444780.1 hypothetical protein [Lishizhenia sp.]